MMSYFFVEAPKPQHLLFFGQQLEIFYVYTIYHLRNLIWFNCSYVCRAPVSCFARRQLLQVLRIGCLWRTTSVSTSMASMANFSVTSAMASCVDRMVMNRCLSSYLHKFITDARYTLSSTTLNCHWLTAGHVTGSMIPHLVMIIHDNLLLLIGWRPHASVIKWYTSLKAVANKSLLGFCRILLCFS